MTGTTTSGWPYVLPADKPLEFPAFSQSQANLLESRFKDLTVRVRVFTGQVTDGNGITTFTPAQLGLTTVLGGLASPSWATAEDGSAALVSAARVNAGNLQTITLTQLSATTVGKFKSKSGITFYVLAWGTA